MYFSPHRGEKKPIPEDLKDEKYFERRKRNNLAAKKSRDQRKVRMSTTLTMMTITIVMMAISRIMMMLMMTIMTMMVTVTAPVLTNSYC